MTNWIYVAEFSCMVEELKKLDKTKILQCDFHPKIPGDTFVTLETSKEEAMNLPFKTYHDNRKSSEECYGGIKIFRVTNTSSFRGKNRLQLILEEYNLD